MNSNLAATTFANGLNAYPDDLLLLSSDAELALLQGDITRCQTRIAIAIPLAKH